MSHLITAMSSPGGQTPLEETSLTPASDEASNSAEERTYVSEPYEVQSHSDTPLSEESVGAGTATDAPGIVSSVADSTGAGTSVEETSGTETAGTESNNRVDETNEENDGETGDDEEVPIASEDESTLIAEGEESEEEVIVDEEYYEEEYDEEFIVEEEETTVDHDGDEGDAVARQSYTTEGTGSGGATEADTQTRTDPDGFRNFAEFPSTGHESNGQSTTESRAGGTASSAGFPSFADQSPDVGAENEYRQNLQFTPAQTAGDPELGGVGMTTTTKETKTVSPMWYWVVCILVLLLLGAGAYVGWFLVNESNDKTPNLGEDDSITFAPTSSPTIGLATSFDAIQGNCQFMNLTNPHVIDQCRCVGEIQIIPDDVRSRYASHLVHFIPTLYEAYDDDMASCSARNQALVWISSGNDFEYTYEERVERFALASLYAGLDGTSWSRKTNWLNENSICNWSGVFCSSRDTAQTLVLTSNDMVGTLPPEMSLLSDMLQLFAANNTIEGPIPEGLFYISFLQQVDLSYNSLTGPVPPAIGNAKYLWDLNLEGNSLSGRLSQQLGGAERLEMVNLANNALVGNLPVEMFTNWTELQHLDVGGNLLSGTIPSDIGKVQNLTSLTLGPNNFRGSIPTEVGNLTKLERLNIDDVPSLSGRIPAVIGRNLKELVELTITATAINGNIETDLGSLSNLVILDLSSNQLRSTLPLEIGNLKNLTFLDLSSNFLEGDLPVSLGDLTLLNSLYLNDNLFVDGIPIDLGNLDGLEELRLDGNVLTGRVANEICNLRLVGSLEEFLVDCPYDDNGVQVGVICSIPDCCTSCRTENDM